MNKIFASLLVSTGALAFTACVGEQAEIFDKSATERLDEAKGIYAKRLTAEGGKWVMEYYPTKDLESPIGLGYLMTCNFTPDYKVTVAMSNDVTNNYYKESTSAWEILTDNGPVLSFNTYNDVLHTFSTPENIPSQSFDGKDEVDETGRGYEGDYEFVITNLDEGADHAMLKGKKRGTYNRITRLDANTDLKEYMADIETFKKAKFPAGGNDLRFVHAGKLYNVQGMASLLPKFYPADGDAEVDKQFKPYLVTKQGDKYYLRFRDAFDSDEETEQEYVYDESKEQFIGVENNANILRGINDDELPAYLNSVGGIVMKFGLNTYSEASDHYKKMVEDFTSGIQTKGYQLQSISLIIINDGTAMDMVISYKSGRTNTNVTYRTTFGSNGDKIEIGTWSDMGNANAKKLYNDFPAVKNFVDALSGSYNLKVVGSRFNISEIRFDKVGDSNFWFSSICR